MSEDDQPSVEIEAVTGGLMRYVRDNPLASVAGALIIGVLLARFAFLGTPSDINERA